MPLDALYITCLAALLVTSVVPFCSATMRPHVTWFTCAGVITFGAIAFSSWTGADNIGWVPGPSRFRGPAVTIVVVYVMLFTLLLIAIAMSPRLYEKVLTWGSAPTTGIKAFLQGLATVLSGFAAIMVIPGVVVGIPYNQRVENPLVVQRDAASLASYATHIANPGSLPTTVQMKLAVSTKNVEYPWALSAKLITTSTSKESYVVTDSRDLSVACIQFMPASWKVVPGACPTIAK